MNNTQVTFCELLSLINSLRHLMITAGQQHGLNSLETLRCSEELDELILEFQNR
ncbi:aspartyl-phosphate phosphatase Spo0E family protein [Domibacillus aminovorans]|uniref:aspartyl-phosphate phosphatase Spo0E family protein n=1 Tax=Domibacillus aminovorans TaxID=29332 RepID=UPI0009EDDD19|nr:aspartyl-phosphate phosphatase Spo0E family protein [Domibacillus aminovorans]